MEGMFKKPPSFFLVIALKIILCGIPRCASQYTLTSSCPRAGPLRDLPRCWPHPSGVLSWVWLTAGKNGRHVHLNSEERGATSAPSLCTFRTHGCPGQQPASAKPTPPVGPGWCRALSLKGGRAKDERERRGAAHLDQKRLLCREQWGGGSTPQSSCHLRSC